MKPAILLQYIKFLLILLFAYAAFSKLAEHAIFRAQLTKFPVLGNYANFFSWCIPALELITAVLLYMPKYSLHGFYAALVLLISFTVFLILMLSFDKNLPCSCGGVISKFTWQEHIVFNLFFLALAIAGIYLHKRQHTAYGQLKQKTFNTSF